MFAFDNMAFASLEEPMEWREDKTPHRTGSFKAIVIHGESESTAAGNVRGSIAADPWSVIVDSRVAICADIREGDTLTRVLVGGETLSVQQITRDDTGWVIKCTSKARAK